MIAILMAAEDSSHSISGKGLLLVVIISIILVVAGSSGGGRGR